MDEKELGGMFTGAGIGLLFVGAVSYDLKAVFLGLICLGLALQILRKK